MKLKHVDFEVPDWGELFQGPQAWRSYAQALIDLNPVAYWRLGETAGAMATDQTAQHHGSYVGGVTLGQPGAIFRDANTAVRFDGSSGRVSVPHDNALNIGGTQPATWLLWARKTDAGTDDGRWLCGKGGPQSGELRYLIETRGTSGAIHFVTHDGAWHDVASNPGLSFQGWRLIGVTWDGQDTMTFYHDGQPVGSESFEPGWFPTTDDGCRLGAARASGFSDDLFHYAGDLDEIALFDTALPAQVIADLFGRGQGAFELD